MSIFNIKRYGEEEFNEDTNNELELLKKLKQRIAQKNITKSSSSTEKLEKSKENEENLPKEPQDEEGAPKENDLPSTTEGKKKRKRKRKSSISNESGNFYKRFIFVFTRKGNGFYVKLKITIFCIFLLATGFTSLGDVASKEKSKVRRVLPKW